MTKKRITALAVAVLVLAIVMGVAATAQAFPTRTSQCSGCHGIDSAVVVAATQTSNNGTTATYDVSVNDAYGDGVFGWAVFDGTANIANGNGAGAFTVAVGKTYTVWGVAGAGGVGSNSISIRPVAPPPPPPPPPPTDTTPPVVTISTPAAGATVSGQVSIGAIASDVGSGVNHVEFRVDGVLVGSDSTSPYSATWDSTGVAAGSHTIEAKAFDNVGLSSAATVIVSIATPPPPPPPALTSVVTVNVHNGSGAAVSGAKVILKNSATGVRNVAMTAANGEAQFADTVYGAYSTTISARGYKRASSSVVVDAPTEAVPVTIMAR